MASTSSSTVLVTQQEVCFLVLNFLKDNNYKQSYTTFQKESASLISNLKPNRSVKTLTTILNEYVRLKTEEKTKKQFVELYGANSLLKNTMESLCVLLDGFSASHKLMSSNTIEMTNSKTNTAPIPSYATVSNTTTMPPLPSFDINKSNTSITTLSAPQILTSHRSNNLASIPDDIIVLGDNTNSRATTSEPIVLKDTPKRKKGLPRKLSTIVSSPAIPAKRRLYTEPLNATTITPTDSTTSWHIPSHTEAESLSGVIPRESFKALLQSPDLAEKLAEEINRHIPGVDTVNTEEGVYSPIIGSHSDRRIEENAPTSGQRPSDISPLPPKAINDILSSISNNPLFQELFSANDSEPMAASPEKTPNSSKDERAAAKPSIPDNLNVDEFLAKLNYL
eukprot:TRINITY_DN8291_c0_g1_i1.p1 TRINITY_DN8291_c0_g1~~TRINITY_DN8291_c0_g1_i1.p1  ORF type:complete len:411 (-),score=79.59 TRINITY_DN8291_c0_g1_i1:45-1226(-)